MRMSDWSSDVCSSDLMAAEARADGGGRRQRQRDDLDARADRTVPALDQLVADAVPGQAAAQSGQVRGEGEAGQGVRSGREADVILREIRIAEIGRAHV